MIFFCSHQKISLCVCDILDLKKKCYPWYWSQGIQWSIPSKTNVNLFLSDRFYFQKVWNEQFLLWSLTNSNMKIRAHIRNWVFLRQQTMLFKSTKAILVQKMLWNLEEVARQLSQLPRVSWWPCANSSLLKSNFVHLLIIEITFILHSLH